MLHNQGKRAMPRAAFTLSAFGDEIDPDLDAQLRLLRDLEIGYLELRSAWGTNVLELSDSQVAAIKTACGRYSVGISCIGSPVGKTPVSGPLEDALADLHRIFRVAEALGTRRVRVFSFYPPVERGGGGQEMFVEEAVSRLSRMAREAERRDMLLLLENERGVMGDTPERCHAILSAVDSPNLRFVWDTANFVVVGVADPVERGWEMLGPYLAHVQIKDGMLSDGAICAAGEGDAQVPELLSRLKQAGYRGFLGLEPHLAMAGRSSGFSGPEGMRHAVRALRAVMVSVGCVEAPAWQAGA